MELIILSQSEEDHGQRQRTFGDITLEEGLMELIIPSQSEEDLGQRERTLGDGTQWSLLSAVVDGSTLQLREASRTSNSIIDEAGSSFMIWVVKSRDAILAVKSRDAGVEVGCGKLQVMTDCDIEGRKVAGLQQIWAEEVTDSRSEQ
ncbi:hypothetical protein BHE74_00056016 [Ensete ventricosum]|uniref:Uncharacterized protein n=1 Tax=Ensete ventricosum TaxID=4639 RepID=A0A426XU14_ENSVE|nr:hypothetical protein B296_00035729 [Ensete ventricosum]RWW38729.1 hypothetical protein BHE74_00056016 [Ensete ventricosum]